MILVLMMAVTTNVGVCILLLVLQTLADEHGSIAIKYDAETFASEVTKKNSFVMFFAPWCGHCKRLAPIWDQLAEKYNEKKSDKDVVIAKVDCTVDTALCSEQDITGYPTLKFFKKSEEGTRYRGPREIDAFEEFISEQLNEATKSEKVKVPVSEKGLAELTDSTFHSHVETGQHFVKFYAPWCGHCLKLAPTWEQLAESLKHDVSVTIAKLDCTEYRSVCNELEIKGYPTLLWFQDGKVVEKYQGGRSHEELKEYVDKMKQKAEENVDSSDSMKIPKEPPPPVVILTEQNFENAAKKGLLFVKYFAPWCGHCKRLAPVWEDLAKKFVGHTGVVIAEVDCTLEEGKDLCTREEVEGYPTMILYKDGKKVEEFTGRRELEDLYSFVIQNLPHDEL